MEPPTRLAIPADSDVPPRWIFEKSTLGAIRVGEVLDGRGACGCFLGYALDGSVFLVELLAHAAGKTQAVYLAVMLDDVDVDALMQGGGGLRGVRSIAHDLIGRGHGAHELTVDVEHMWVRRQRWLCEKDAAERVSSFSPLEVADAA